MKQIRMITKRALRDGGLFFISPEWFPETESRSEVLLRTDIDVFSETGNTDLSGLSGRIFFRTGPRARNYHEQFVKLLNSRDDIIYPINFIHDFYLYIRCILYDHYRTMPEGTLA